MRYGPKRWARPNRPAHTEHVNKEAQALMVGIALRKMGWDVATEKRNVMVQPCNGPVLQQAKLKQALDDLQEQGVVDAYVMRESDIFSAVVEIVDRAVPS